MAAGCCWWSRSVALVVGRSNPQAAQQVPTIFHWITTPHSPENPKKKNPQTLMKIYIQNNFLNTFFF
jgi:hypothetical protein